MKIRGQGLKTSLSCLLSLLLVLSSFGMAAAENYEVDMNAELVPAGQIDFEITAQINVSNTRDDADVLTFTPLVITNNEPLDGIKVSKIAYSAPQDPTFTLAQSSTDFSDTANADKFAILISNDNIPAFDLATGDYTRGGRVEANSQKIFNITGKLGPISDDMDDVSLGSLVVTVESGKLPAYVLIESPTDNNIILKLEYFSQDSCAAIQYSFDGISWDAEDTLASAKGSNSYFITGHSKLYLRGVSPNGFSGESILLLSAGPENLKLSGNIMSLLDYRKLERGEMPTLPEDAFYCLFAGSPSLEDASELLLPASTVPAGAYKNMFNFCEHLVKPPALPATEVGDMAYNSMFAVCTSLEYLPWISMTKFTANSDAVAESACEKMFTGCSNIKISKVKTGEYQTEYIVPPCANDNVDNYYMFSDTGGTFKDMEVSGGTYYTSNGIIYP